MGPLMKWWKAILGMLVAVGAALLVGGGWLQLRFTGHMDGFFLLRGEQGGYQLADDLYLGDEERLLASLDLPSPRRWFQRAAASGPKVELDWNVRDGEGVIRNHLDGERELRIHFSRYQDSDNRYPHGLFIGGETAEELLAQDDDRRNNSGMSYFDGIRWRHIWCNTNEGLGSTVSRESAGPSGWTFLGSRVLRSDAKGARLASDHHLVLDGVPLAIEREVTVDAGDPFVQLTIRITNQGQRTAHYFYYYGDEPWLGDFGSSKGDVGWVPDRPVLFEERIDPTRYNVVGMMDAGNQLIGEAPVQSPLANFIEWRGTNRPDIVFFANRYYGYTHPDEVRVPLMGDARSVGLYWKPRVLEPGESQTIELSVGLADFDPSRGLPQRPRTGHQAALATAEPHAGAG